MRFLRKINNFLLNILYNTPRVLFINFYKYGVARIRVYWPKKIPKNSSAIFAFNHTTGADPIIVLSALKRKIYFLADSDRFRTKFTDFFFRKILNSIPLFKKEHIKNAASFKEMFSISKDRKIFFGIFPEGNLIKNGSFGKFHDGAAYLSYKTKIPIVPVYIHNMHKGPRPDTWCGRNPICEGIYSLFSNAFRRVNVFIGDPINPVAEEICRDLMELTNRENYKEILDKITCKLEEEFNELKNEAEKTVNTRKAKNKKKPVFKKATSFSEIKEMPENSSTVIIKPEFGAPDVKNPFEDYDKDKDGEFPENNLADNI